MAADLETTAPAADARSGSSEPHASGPSRRRLAFLCLTAIGVVYGDIGTSPLYAVRECFSGPHAVAVNEANVLGILSLIVWTLVVVVTLKYHIYVLRADNDGEGGILALMALATQSAQRRSLTLLALGLFGAALLYGDGMLTPVISVLGAMEGLKVATPQLEPYIVPISILILVLLFLFQRRGTAGVGIFFGPVILVWFITIATLGLLSIVQTPEVLRAFNPVHAVRFYAENGLSGYLVLGSVFLVATGGEALYADLGHFGEPPIQIDWFSIVAPSLLLNYFGQGALVLRDPAAADNPFYRLAPEWGQYPLLIIATLAAIIASQAVISGVFSLTRQAVQLGYAPRVEIVHTSAREMGQIYVPAANWALMVATVMLTLGFRTSSNIAAAYGVAVTTTMIITTLLAFVVARQLWRWKLGLAVAATALFLSADLAFFGANIVKISQGGWFPLGVAAIMFAVFTSWRRGNAAIRTRLTQTALPPEILIEDIERRGVHRVPGTAVFLTSHEGGIPAALGHNLKHNKIVHDRNIFLTLVTEHAPHVDEEHRLAITELSHGFYRVTGRYGFMEDADVPELLRALTRKGLEVDPAQATYLLSRTTVLSRPKLFALRWLDSLFIFMQRNATMPTRFFHLTPNRVIEIGMQVEI